jgi:hypothetical protein
MRCLLPGLLLLRLWVERESAALGAEAAVCARKLRDCTSCNALPLSARNIFSDYVTRYRAAVFTPSVSQARHKAITITDLHKSYKLQGTGQFVALPG